MLVRLAYGETGIEIEVPNGSTVVKSSPVPGLDDERDALREAMRTPQAGTSLPGLIRDRRRVVLVFPDVTRAMPSDRVVPAIMDELNTAGFGPDRVTLLSATGTHRSNTPQELERMLGADIVERYTVVNHDARDNGMLVKVGTTSQGAPALLNRVYLDADVRIIAGLIEPHFFAGYSGGPKGVCPGVAGLETVLYCHDARRIGHPAATWGQVVGNPVQELLREVVAMAPPTFTLDVTVNQAGSITGVFAGSGYSAHAAGCKFVARTQECPVQGLFDVVITTNGGYPLDQNLYQAIKGLSAAARIVKPGGAIILAAECRDGIPEHGRYGAILSAARNRAEIMASLHNGAETVPDQWQAQVQALVQEKADVYAFCGGLSEEQIRAAHLRPCLSIERTLAEIVGQNADARVAVMPEGPYAVPVLA